MTDLKETQQEQDKTKSMFEKLKEKSTTQFQSQSQSFKIQNSAKTLRGSGITKRKAEAAEKHMEKQQQQAYAFQESHKEEMGELINLNIPSTLTDDSIKLDEYQQSAVDGAKHQKYVCIIGQAGVGKTTVTKAIVKELLPTIPTIDLNFTRLENDQSMKPDYNAAMCFCSFMGKAVQQIKRALPKEYHPLCKTIHATLGYSPVMEERQDEKTKEWYEVKVFRPHFTKYNKLPYKLIIVDEAGSVPIYLWNELIEALPDDCRIILMGDLNQLPPVQGRSVLGFAIIKWPTYVLSKIHRQAADNPIIANADRIIHGKKPLKDSKKFVIMDMPDSAFACFNKTVAVIQTLHKKELFDPLRDAFLVPQNKDTIGQIAFNEKLVRYFNPTKKIDNIAINPPIVITAGFIHVTYAVGDKIMCLANDRQLGLTNGMIGVITEIHPNEKFKGEAVADQILSDMVDSTTLDLSNLHEEINSQSDAAEEKEESERQASHTVIVQFQNVDNPVFFKTTGDFRKLTHSYAMTGHKSQGSEYPTVVILLHSVNLTMLSREWLYTTVTRAQERVILLTNTRGLTHAVNRQKLKGKTIQEKAERFIKLSKAEDTKLPELHEPKEI